MDLGGRSRSSSDSRYLKVPGLVALSVYVVEPLPVFVNMTSTPSMWFCQSGSPVATSVVMSPGTMLTSAALPFGFEASTESGPVGVSVATLSGAPLMKAPTLIVHVTDAPAARAAGP